MHPRTVCIDHIVSNTGFTDLSKIEPQASSACEVLYGTMDADKISRNVAECIYTGIIHDTGVFKYKLYNQRRTNGNCRRDDGKRN